jgi:hypothetical protein
MPFSEAATETTIVHLQQDKIASESACVTSKRRVIRRKAHLQDMLARRNPVKCQTMDRCGDDHRYCRHTQRQYRQKPKKAQSYVAYAEIKVMNGGSGVLGPTIEFPGGYLSAVLEPDYELHGAETEVMA